MNLKEVPKKVQYVMIDSNFVTGTNNTFSINFDISSNTMIESMKDVIGIKLADFFVTQIGSSDVGNVNAAKYIDIYCPEVPTPGQILDERRGQLFNRIALERNFGGSNNLIVHDKQWKSFYRNTNYFNPISIKKLNFTLHENRGDNDYNLLQPDASFYMILEITTIDHEAPKPDKLARSIEKLCRRLDNLPDIILNPPPEPVSKPVGKKIPFMYLIGALVAILGGWLYFMRSGSSQGVPLPPGLP
tara:strand:- start:1593 stop:2327 length:735 start_codon:yes stop_codon:yes gene_type:complete